MKKILYILSVAAVSVTSCAKLEESPDSIITTEQFYKTSADAVSAINSVYTAGLNPGPIMMYNRLFNIAVEVQSDDVIAGQRVTNVDVRAMSALTYSTTNDRIDELWKEHYIAIDRANIAIDKIPAIDMDGTLRTRLVNEAKFLRGLLYFNLVRLWGEVPLVLHTPASLKQEEIQVAKSPVEDVYQQIIQDLSDAEALPATYAGNDIGRATGGAAKALLSKVYLTRQEWAKAASKALEVINGPYGYALFENFSDVFNVATKNGKEHIFSAQCKGGIGLGNRLAASATPVGIPGITAAGTDEPTSIAYGLYSANDRRRATTFFTSLISPTNGRTYTFTPKFSKYWDPTSILTPTESNQNIPIIRYAEVLLIYAEALNEANATPSAEAYEALNKVIRRAFGKAINTPDNTVDIANLDKAAFREEVYKQRRLELMFEFQRWFDLIRTKRMISALQVVGKTASEKHYLFPIPQHEIDLNPKLEQNPLWK
ncbi:RagB/SusD family nutrient uptake outer membrane protein [Desertivirga arenae]|uniref:RagB/SusD family nutrient uptake outer membrane protein n=1 Tax=Desertivirga arenae TaxID=2810309 RepID=UPI001A975F16|nr:RagB/SusD family nutrient uptake outer membrane protein [Pedobacter sp. SYSU D00823]